MRDFYEVLGVQRDATPNEIKKAYRRLAHQYHPDKNPGDTAAEERFKEATHAYDILSDTAKRQRYDRFGAAGVGAGGADDFGFGRGGAGFAQGVGDVFSEIFGDFFGRRGPKQQERGRDKTLTLNIPFEAAVHGGERVVDVTRSQRCGTCSGTGSRPGSAPQICHACGGSGDLKVQQGMFSVSKKCLHCRGRGRIINDPCHDCSGQGRSERAAQLKVRIPPGADTGTVVRYAGEGEPGQGGAPSGDLRVTLKVEAHPYFRREGADLHCELPITLVDAALGRHVDVPTLDGRVRMKLPPGTGGGRVFRLRGKGLPRMGGGEPGDLHVTVSIETPQALDDAERTLIEALAGLDTPQHYPKRAAVWEGLKRPEP
ncbi:MAG TPA: molecular chaperone DnaJ [Myxococcota bacterium]|nr:molecular chaperone DnaJ [Myxococcota bacterium]